jgi:hypothetical protein
MLEGRGNAPHVETCTKAAAEQQQRMGGHLFSHGKRLLGRRAGKNLGSQRRAAEEKGACIGHTRAPHPPYLGLVQGRRLDRFGRHRH